LTRTPGPPVPDDLVERAFTADRVDQLWLTDVTEHPTTEGELYLCAIKDACSRRIVGYSILGSVTGTVFPLQTQELRALRWENVRTDTVPEHLEVWRSVRAIGNTKTRKSRRTLALWSLCVEALRVQRARQVR
jgi:hypothetical protein